MLERLRFTFRWKVDGLDADGLRFRIPSSELSLGGLLTHLTPGEDDVFAQRIAGEDPAQRTSSPRGADGETWQFEVWPGESPAAIYSAYDAPSAITFDGLTPSIRRFVCDLIEEYGRHTGHADLIREALDGRVGEDPPKDWRPSECTRPA
jgi:hypothetical protein